MNYATIKNNDIANGPGVRTTLFVSGCRRHCKECFNPEAWPLAAGMPFTEAVQQEIIDSLAPDYISGLTLLGGEPFEPENQRGLVDFVERVRATYPTKSLWSFSGFTIEELLGREPVHAPYTISPVTEVTDRLLMCLDVLVDGFDEELEQFYGRTYADSPEIDGRVWIATQEAIPEGAFVKVCIDSVVDGDLSGCLLEEEE